jgi:hypothetical protein
LDLDLYIKLEENYLVQRDKVIATTVQVFSLLDLLKELHLAIYERLPVLKQPNDSIHLRLAQLER